MVDSFSSSSRSRRLGFETSGPAFDRPELDRPKLNMIANGVLPLYIMVRYSRMRLKISLLVYLGIVVIGFIYVASLMLSLIDEIETMAMDVQSSRSSGVYTAMLNERWEHELEYAWESAWKWCESPLTKWTLLCCAGRSAPNLTSDWPRWLVVATQTQLGPAQLGYQICKAWLLRCSPWRILCTKYVKLQSDGRMKMKWWLVDSPVMLYSLWCGEQGRPSRMAPTSHRKLLRQHRLER